MTQTLKKVSLLLTSFVFIVAAAVINVQPVQAAPQSQNLNGNLTFDPDDNPRLNANPATTATFGGFGISNGSEGAPGQTTADANVNQIYTWRLPNLSDHICSNAQLTSLRIVADVSATVEGTPDLAALMLYRIDGSDTYNVGSYAVQQGVDYAPVTGGVTPPGNEGIYGVVRGTDPALGGQLAGQLEATWNLSSFDATDNFGVMIQQDSEDGTVDLQTTISALELSYDDENCNYDGAITKTLLNPSAVVPGGQAVFEITVTNNGNEPLPFNGGLGDMGVYDIASPSLIYQSVASDDVDIECENMGVIEDLFATQPDQLLPYQNHLDYSLIFCAGQSSQIIPPGESRSFQLTFNVIPGAPNVTNFTSWVVPGDPGMQALSDAANSLQPGGVDMLDLLLSGALVSDNVSIVSHTFSSDSGTVTDGSSGLTSGLAETGSSSYMYVVSAIAMLITGGGIVVARRFRQTRF